MCFALQNWRFAFERLVIFFNCLTESRKTIPVMFPTNTGFVILARQVAMLRFVHSGRLA